MYKATINIKLPASVNTEDEALDWVAENIPLSGDYAVEVEPEEIS
jgi:hypothetical protein